jgi:hypothetical protein
MIGCGLWVGTLLGISFTAIGGNHLAERETPLRCSFLGLGLGSEAKAKRNQKGYCLVSNAVSCRVGMESGLPITQSKICKDARKKETQLERRDQDFIHVETRAILQR